MTTEGSAALAVVHQATPVATLAPLRFTPEQKRLILDTCFGGASPTEAAALIAVAEARGMNPLAQECYFVQRWDTEKGRMVWAVQAGIDSFRAKAEETGLYAGQDEPEFEYDEKGHVKVARVRVYRKDWPRPMVGVARWEEYVQTKKDGSPTRFWTRMPHNQLAKCAEAAGLRKAFPKVFARIYAPEEMEQAETPPHDPETGEVREPGPGAAAAAAAIAGRIDADVARQRFDLRRAEIVQAPDLDTLQGVWTRVLADAKKAAITLDQRAQLAALKDARKVTLKEGVKAEQDRALDVGKDDPGGLGPGKPAAPRVRKMDGMGRIIEETASGTTTFGPSCNDAPDSPPPPEAELEGDDLGGDRL